MTQITLNDAISTAIAAPKLTYFFEGSPGCGKTFKTRAMLEHAGYDVTLVSCQNMPIEDTAMLPIKQKDGTIKFAANEIWKPTGKRQAFILDELPKAPEDVFNAFNGLLYGAPRSMQGFEYGPNTIVIVTANPEQFGAGDQVRPHHVNRMVMFSIDNPTPTDAQDDMYDLNFHASVIGWVAKTPQALVSYDAEVQEKPVGEAVGYYGYLASLPKRPFCSMRSLEGVSRALHANLPRSLLKPTVIGLIGFDAASAFFLHHDAVGEVIPLDVILADPDAAPLPAKLFDQRHQAITLAASLDAGNALTLFTYAARLKPDVFRGVFLTAVVRKRVWVNQLVAHPLLNKAHRDAFE